MACICWQTMVSGPENPHDKRTLQKRIDLPTKDNISLYTPCRKRGQPFLQMKSDWSNTWDLERVSWLERCPDYYWDKTKCPDETRCPDLKVSTFRGFTVYRQIQTNKQTNKQTLGSSGFAGGRANYALPLCELAVEILGQVTSWKFWVRRLTV